MNRQDFLVYRTINNALDSSSLAEVHRREAIREVTRDFPKSLDVDKFFLWDKKTTDICLYLNTYNKEFSTVIGHKQEFTCLNDCAIETGSIVYNPKEDIFWLCMYSAQMDYIYKKGILYRCNTILRWRDESGTVWEYPAHDANTTQYNSGVDQGRNVDYVTSQHKILTTSDENTNNLKIDTRFFLGKNNVVPDIFKLTQNDTSSMNYDKGIVSLTLFRGQYDPRLDDITEHISLNTFTNDTSDNPVLSIVGGSELIIGERKKVTLSQPSLSDNPNIFWAIKEEDFSKLVTIQETDKNSCILFIDVSKEAITSIGKNFTLECYDGDTLVANHVFKITGGV